MGFCTEINRDPDWGRKFVSHVWGHQESWQVYTGGAQTVTAKIPAEENTAELQQEDQGRSST